MAKKKQSFWKRLGRKTAKVSVKVNRVTTPIVAAAAGYFYGAPGAAAVTAIGAESGRYFRATQARDEGVTGRSARALGRGERKRVAIYGAIGGGAGMLGSGITTLARGYSVPQALGNTLFGQSGGHILGIGGTVFDAAPSSSGLSSIVTAGNFAAQKASIVPGIVTQSQLAPSLVGGTSELAGAGTGGASTGAKLLGTLPTLLGALGKGIPTAPQPGVNPSPYGSWPNPQDYQGGMFGGGGGGGESGGGGGGFMNAPGVEGDSKGGLIAAVMLGALLLAG